MARTTDRTVRRVVRLLNIEDTPLTKDVAEVEKLVKSLQCDSAEDKTEVTEELSVSEQPEVPCEMVDESTERKKVSPIRIVKRNLGYRVETAKPRCRAYCCCPGHCNFVYHGKAGSVARVEKETNFNSEVLGNVDEVDSLQSEDCLNNVHYTDSFTDIIQCLNMDFSLQ